MKRKRKVLYLSSVSAVLLLFGVVLGFHFVENNKTKNEAENITIKYFTLLNEKKYEEMYSMILEKSKKNISKEDFITRHRNIYEGIGGRNIEVSDIKVNCGTLNIESTFSFKMESLAGDISFVNTMNIEIEGEALGVNWSSNLIFNELNDDYKVRVETEKGKRGDILDRNNEKLATDSVLAQVGLVIEELGEDKEKALENISKELNLPLDYINKKISEDWVKPFMFIPLKTYSYKDELVEKARNIKGVKVQDKSGRVYPLGEKAGHLTGYVQNVTKEDLDKNEGKGYGENSVIGRSGLEAIYEDRLRGIDGVKIYIVDEYSKEVKTVGEREVKHGENIKLTIDSTLQEVAYDVLGNEKGATVSLNPDTGEVLTLVSSPSYNPNDFVVGLTNEKWDELNTDDKKPMYNRFQSNITPGSAFKPITAAIGIETGKLNPMEDKKISGLKWQKDGSWGGYKVTRVKEYDFPSNLENALIFSDNIFFARVALDMGEDNFINGLKKFGMTEKLPFEYGVAKSQISATGKLENEILLADSGYGQGQILINPLELSTMYTAFKNSGDIIAPYLEYKDTIEKKILRKDVIRDETSKIVLNGLEKVVENPSGTASRLKNQDYRVFAKTGTAEIKDSQDDVNGTEIGWVVAMTSEKENNILVTSFIEDVKSKGGSSYVVPKVKDVLDSIE